MLNLAQNPALKGLIAQELQASINLYHEAFKQTGYIRFDRPLLDAQTNAPITLTDGTPRPDLMTEFRTLATKLDSRMEFAKTAQIIEFVRKALQGSLVMPPELTFTPYGARPERTTTDPVTGEIRTQRALKAQVIASFGKPPSRLSADAQERNAKVASKWDALIASVKPAAPETPAADTASEV